MFDGVLQHLTTSSMNPQQLDQSYDPEQSNNYRYRVWFLTASAMF